MIGVVAAIAASVGDLLLLLSSNAARPDLLWLPRPSGAVLLAGTYLGVVAIPLYGIGYREVAARFADPMVRRWIVALGTVGGVLGGTTHGLTGLVIHVERASGTAPGDPMAMVARYGAFLLPLWGAIAIVSIVGAAIYAVAVLSGRSSLPGWMALANPAVITLGLAAAGQASVLGQAFLVPAAPNLAHVVFFALVALRRGARP